MALSEEDAKVAELADEIITKMQPIVKRQIKSAIKEKNEYFPAAFATAMVYLAAQATAACTDYSTLDTNANAATMQLRRTISNLVHVRLSGQPSEPAQEP